MIELNSYCCRLHEGGGQKNWGERTLLQVKRAYDTVSEGDGFRILVDRLWPRGMSKERAKIDLWLKEIAPDDNLRKWFAHDENKWEEFKRKYHKELAGKESLVRLITKKLSAGNVTLVYAAKNDRFNNAVALKEYLDNNQRS